MKEKIVLKVDMYCDKCRTKASKVAAVTEELIKGPGSKEEDNIIVEMFNQLGAKKWSTIAQALHGRIRKQCRESGLPDGDEVEEMSEYSQGSTAVGCSQTEFDLPTFVVNSQEDKVIDDRNQRVGQSSSSSSCSKYYYTSHEEVTWSGSEVPCRTVFSAKSSEPNSHELPCTSAVELVRGSSDLIETSRYSSAIEDKNQEIGSLCLQSSMELNSSTFMAELVSISEDNCYRVTYSESVINECFSAQNLPKCSNYNELNGCTGLNSASQLYDAVRSSEVAVTASYQSLLTTPFSDECNEIESVFGGT
ncbi:hypothetical protein GIB67_022953 [Kingdonia uniflora]|uniref:Uncharacterized protein n=1 Tax=Kingdonia uniflora TaxID=39325 RepID=A0A7J7P351_9MAGN|nr:hypothetical protein GIB67_022953 [Kingdonia uniflora]